MKKSQEDLLNELTEKNNESGGVALKPTKTKTPTPEPSRAGGLITKQQQSAKSMLKKKQTVQLMHDPSRIRMWKGHNRDYEALNAQNCSDLIEAFGRGAEGQRFAAIVRKVEDSADFDYEVICGARRHWTSMYRQMDLLIEIRTLSDKEAFILQDLENRDRQDVSDLERAIDYKRALKDYFDDDIQAFSSYLKYDRGNLIKLMGLADLPKEIIAAYSDLRDLKTHHGITYKQLLAEPVTRKRLMEYALEARKQKIDSKSVYKHLCQAKQGK